MIGQAQAPDEPSASTTELTELDKAVAELYRPFWTYVQSHEKDTAALQLFREAHVTYLTGALGRLSGAVQSTTTVRLSVSQLLLDCYAMHSCASPPLTDTACWRSAILRTRHALGMPAGGYSSLDAARPWVAFWVAQGLALLGYELAGSPYEHGLVAFLRSCQHAGGGFAGGPGQLPHLAPTCVLVSFVKLGSLHAFALRMATA